MNDNVRFTTEEAVQFAKAQAMAKYRQNEAVDTERRATQAEIERAKSEEARVQAQKEKQEAEQLNNKAAAAKVQADVGKLLNFYGHHLFL